MLVPTRKYVVDLLGSSAAGSPPSNLAVESFAASALTNPPSRSTPAQPRLAQDGSPFVAGSGVGRMRMNEHALSITTMLTTTTDLRIHHTLAQTPGVTDMTFVNASKAMCGERM